MVTSPLFRAEIVLVHGSARAIQHNYNTQMAAKKLQQLTHANERFSAIFHTSLNGKANLCARSCANPHIVRVAISHSQVVVSINSMSARTVPRPRCGEYRGSSRIDVAATLDSVVGVDRRVLIIGIITHVQGRRLMDNSSHQELRDIRP